MNQLHSESHPDYAYLPQNAIYTLSISTDNGFTITIARGAHDQLYPQMVQLIKALPASTWVDMHSLIEDHHYMSKGEYKDQ